MKITLENQTKVKAISQDTIKVDKIVVAGGERISRAKTGSNSLRVQTPTGGLEPIKVKQRDQTLVKKVVVGRPVRRVTTSQGSINSLDDVDASGAVEGSVLVYRELSSQFEATLTLEQQFINGGHY